nr:immunoglobulin heavy chain junction region [Mus musculus]MBK4185735.1 immunoglobulin heavy chain junction region [Mus musculus]MBK4185736.1 immunoglobulin heavy chain junction region [Mus musculus]MBK4185737.1 immunoglobulin heavy chain junction region [Mus musculus]MBK4185738.1 immunoglobulin heavy chain junction region [Mus musculus]
CAGASLYYSNFGYYFDYW